MSIWERLVRFGFRLLYNELAWTYDIVSWAVSFGKWRQWQRTLLPFVEGERVLEIAHGPGHLLKELAPSYQVVGMDLSPAMGRIAQNRSGVPLVRGMAQSLPFPREAFDTILTTFPTEFFAQEETISDVYRVLGENGRFLIVPLGYFDGTSPVHRFVDWLYAVTGQGRPRPEHARSHLFTTFSERAEASGFSVSIQQISIKGGGATVIIAQK